MATAYFLVFQGYAVDVFEARDRIGGRVLTDRDMIAGACIEMGAELIGDNHALWLGLADAFGLQLADLSERDPEDMPLLLDGRRYSGSAGAAIWQGIDDACATLNDHARAITTPYRPWTCAMADDWDNRSLGSWIDDHVAPGPVRTAVEGLFSNDNVVPTSEQSLLGTLASVSGGGVENFWTDSENYRCRQGNDALATAIETALARTERVRVHRDTAVTDIDTQDGVVTVCSEAAPARAEGPYGCVVLTAPHSAWHHLTVDGAPIPGEYRMQMGNAMKFFSVLRDRFWGPHADSPAPSGMAAARLLDAVGQGESWEGTDPAQTPAGPVELSVFAGGPAATEAVARLGDGTLNEWYARMLEALYPGYRDHLLSTKAQAWPVTEWIETGYSCPAPGQVTSVAPRLAQRAARFNDKLVFAGEQACPAFFGFMEGALESGLIAMGLVTSTAGVDNYSHVVAALDLAAVAGRP